jgi:hypothetical protein
MTFFPASSALDRIAIGLSALCTLHCVVAPSIVVLFPALAVSVAADDAFHRYLATLVLPSSVLALYLGCARHRDRVVIFLGCATIALLLAIVSFGHALLGEPGERIGTIACSLAIAGAHRRNARLCRSDACDGRD